MSDIKSLTWSDKQKEFWKATEDKKYRFLLKGGAASGGKTFMDYYLIFQRIMNLDGLDGQIFLIGNTKRTLQTNIIDPMRKIWGQKIISDIRSDNSVFMFGEKCYAIGADSKSQVDKLRGSSIKYAYCDELVSFFKDVFEMLKSRLRYDYSVVDATFNPDSPGHWVKEFIDSGNDEIYYQKYTLYDNPFLPQSVIESMEKSYPIGSIWHSRLIMGDWVKAEGIIYPQFSDLNIDDGGHVFRDDQIPDGSEWAVSLDYGTVNATSAGLWKIRGNMAYLVKEYYHDGRKDGQRTDDEHAVAIVQMASSIGTGFTGRIKCYVDPSAASFRLVLKRQGFFWVENAKNDVLDGIRSVGGALSRHRITINENCKNTINELKNYTWDDKSIDGKEQPLKENDHACDMVRYFVSSHMMKLSKWI